LVVVAVAMVEFNFPKFNLYVEQEYIYDF